MPNNRAKPKPEASGMEKPKRITINAEIEPAVTSIAKAMEKVTKRPMCCIFRFVTSRESKHDHGGFHCPARPLTVG
jgi:hypothetical protein